MQFNWVAFNDQNINQKGKWYFTWCTLYRNVGAFRIDVLHFDWHSLKLKRCRNAETKIPLQAAHISVVPLLCAHINAIIARECIVFKWMSVMALPIGCHLTSINDAMFSFTTKNVLVHFCCCFSNYFFRFILIHLI